jgi:HlyD family secretion protein
MSGGRNIFRPEALERLASPEQLDELMVVTDSKGWVTLAAVGLILLVALVWSVLGSIPTSIQGSGVLLRQGGIYDIQAPGSGKVLSVLTAEDSVVQEGQIVGYIAQPDLVARIDVAKQDVTTLKARRAQEARLQDQALKVKLDVLVQDSVRLSGEVASFTGQLQFLQTRLDNAQEAHRVGLVTGETVEAVRQQIATVQSQLSSDESQLTGIENQRIQAQHDRDTQVGDLDEQVRNAESRLSLLNSQLTSANEIRSPYHGRVTQIMVDAGQLVTVGTAVASLELIDKPLEAVIFVPTVGAKAREGLTVHIQPLTVNWQDYGYMVGTVSFVSSGPVTEARMNRILKNEVLARNLAAGGSPYLLEVSLKTAHTPSGYAWTSGEGPPASETTIEGGLLCSAKIVTQSQRPITLVIPALRKFFGI